MAKNQFGIEMDQYAPNEQNLFNRGWQGLQDAGNWLGGLFPSGEDITKIYGENEGTSILQGTRTPEGGKISNPFAWGGNTTLGPEGYAKPQSLPPLAGGPPGVNQSALEQPGVNQPLMQLYDSSKYLSTAGDQRSGHITGEQSIYDKNNPLAQPSDDTLGGYDPEYFKNEYNQYADWGFFDFMNMFGGGEEEEVGDEGEEIEKTPRGKKSPPSAGDDTAGEGILGNIFKSYAAREKPVYQYSRFGEEE